MQKYTKHTPLLIVTILILSVFLFFGPNSLLSSKVAITALYSEIKLAFLLVSVIMILWGGIDFIYTKISTKREGGSYKNYVIIGFAIFSIIILLHGMTVLHERSFCCGGTNSFDPQDFDDASIPSG